MNTDYFKTLLRHAFGYLDVRLCHHQKFRMKIDDILTRIFSEINLGSILN